MAKRRKKKIQTALTARQKKQLSGLLAIVRRFPRKKKPTATGTNLSGGAAGSDCQQLAADIIRQAATVKSLTIKGIATTAQYNFFAQQQALLNAKLANFAQQGCSQALIVGKI